LREDVGRIRMQLAENIVVAGRFRLSRMIGRGGMGSVWQATHLGLDIPCAVKFMEGEYAGLAEAQARFEREAKAAAQLRSPHVVQILDHGVWESTPYIAMELLDGEDLGKRLQRSGTMSPAEVNTVVQQVCRALTKAHQAGIVHRDLKPDNIFLVRDDDREIVKVLDFGIAKKSSGLDTGNNTKTGAMLGTPFYMSPEQAQGTKGVDARSDLWSLAVIVFQAITGRLPFESEALGDLLVRIIMAPIPVPSQVGRVPAQFDRWWARAAERDPAKRFQTARELADSLALVLEQSAVTDVMDRPPLAMAGTALMPADAAPRAPAASAPNLGASTPQPGAPGFAHASGVNSPGETGALLAGLGERSPHRGEPRIDHGPQTAGANWPGSTTGAVSTDPVAPVRKSGIAIAAVVGLVLLLGVAGGGYAVLGRNKPAAAGATSPAATATATDVTAPAVPSVPPVAMAAASARPIAMTDPSASAAPPVPIVPTVQSAVAARHGGTPRAVPALTPKPVVPVAPTITPPPASGGKKSVPADLGF
jgi:hypothetical protein